MHARYFSAHLGRFQSVDALGGVSQLPQSWNRYSYVLGNPLKYTDPYGLQWWEVFQQVPDYIPYWESITVTNHFYFLPSRGRDTTSPWGVGWEWLSGLGKRDRFFFDGDTFTEMLKQHEPIQQVVQGACEGSRAPEGPISNNLGGIQGVPKYLRDYSTLATGGLTGNLAATYLGSYSGEYKLSEGTVQMTVTNTSAAASAFRPPVLGYTAWWQNNVDPRLNQLFASGPMSATSQTFVMNVACP